MKNMYRHILLIKLCRIVKYIKYADNGLYECINTNCINGRNMIISPIINTIYKINYLKQLGESEGLLPQRCIKYLEGIVENRKELIGNNIRIISECFCREFALIVKRYSYILNLLENETVIAHDVINYFNMRDAIQAFISAPENINSQLNIRQEDYKELVKVDCLIKDNIKLLNNVINMDDKDVIIMQIKYPKSHWWYWD